MTFVPQDATINGSKYASEVQLMPEYQKRHISVSPDERRRLEEDKKRYEDKHGSTDWGGFLTAAVGLGLAGLGVYSLAKTLQRSPRSAKVGCPECGTEFVVALPTGTGGHPMVLEVDCPECGAELVIQPTTVEGEREARSTSE